MDSIDIAFMLNSKNNFGFAEFMQFRLILIRLTFFSEKMSGKPDRRFYANDSAMLMSSFRSP